MSIRNIMIYPDPVLKQICEPVTEFDEDLSKLLDDMFETMYTGNGIGLAAPQVSITKRLLVCDVSFDGKNRLELINPEIVAAEGNIQFEEGCLSIPDYREKVERSKTVRIKAQNRSGEDFFIDADDIQSVCIQHEIDHLDGVLFVDRISRLKRELFKRWYKKRAPLGG